jgi:transcriptional regulator with XRE-family HTH domain
LRVAGARTSGLRREEVAQRANISPTWYTWLEQGRRGSPSAAVLDRIAEALLLTEVEREHLYLLGLGRPPGTRFHGADDITPRLQRLLDALPFSPAFLRTSRWDVLAWNCAASIVLTNFGALPAHQRNVLRMIFCNPQMRAEGEWDAIARAVVSTFRIDAARAGASAEVQPLVDELCRASLEFAELWHDNDVVTGGDGIKHLSHHTAGTLALECSTLAVVGRPDLQMVVFNPAMDADRERIISLSS